jgi:hypothetical protein
MSSECLNEAKFNAVVAKYDLIEIGAGPAGEKTGRSGGILWKARLHHRPPPSARRDRGEHYTMRRTVSHHMLTLRRRRAARILPEAKGDSLIALCLLQYVPREVFVFYYRVQPLMDVCGVYPLFAARHFWSTKREFFEQPFEDSM